MNLLFFIFFKKKNLKKNCIFDITNWFLHKHRPFIPIFIEMRWLGHPLPSYEKPVFLTIPIKPGPPTQHSLKAEMLRYYYFIGVMGSIFGEKSQHFLWLRLAWRARNEKLSANLRTIGLRFKSLQIGNPHAYHYLSARGVALKIFFLGLVTRPLHKLPPWVLVTPSKIYCFNVYMIHNICLPKLG